jgi:hypothetical protein
MRRHRDTFLVERGRDAPRRRPQLLVAVDINSRLRMPLSVATNKGILAALVYLLV